MKSIPIGWSLTTEGHDNHEYQSPKCSKKSSDNLWLLDHMMTHQSLDRDERNVSFPAYDCSFVIGAASSLVKTLHDTASLTQFAGKDWECTLLSVTSGHTIFRFC